MTPKQIIEAYEGITSSGECSVYYCFDKIMSWKHTGNGGFKIKLDTNKEVELKEGDEWFIRYEKTVYVPITEYEL